MLRHLTSLLLLLAFVAQTLNGPFLLFGYYANTAAYAQNCINKAIPKMHCNGKCQLMKKLQAQQKKDQQVMTHGLEIRTALLSCSLYYPAVRPFYLVPILFPSHQLKATRSVSLDVFHPPQA